MAEYWQPYALAVRSYEGIILWNNHLRATRHPIHSTARSVPGSHKELIRSSILKIRRLVYARTNCSSFHAEKKTRLATFLCLSACSPIHFCGQLHGTDG